MNDTLPELVQDALAHYYDLAALSHHALAQQLAAQGLHPNLASQRLRELLADALEALRPSDTVPYDRPEWLRYRVLIERYVECRTPQEVCQELGLGRTSFFKYQKAGIEALAGELAGDWAGSEENERESDKDISVARKEARRAASAAVHRPVDASALTKALLQALEPVAERDHVQVHVNGDSSLPSTSGDQALLRQALAAAFSEALSFAEARSVALSVRVQSGEIMWRMAGLSPSFHTTWETQTPDSRAIAEEILIAHQGHCLTRSSSGGAVLQIALPVTKTDHALVVDDDPAVAGLYGRYLAPLGLTVDAAHSADEAWQQLTASTPRVVLLDVLMPGQDGWDILQALRDREATRYVPVVVCSVLVDPDSAMAMGATAVLKKPVDAIEMFTTVSRILDRADSEDAPSS